MQLAHGDEPGAAGLQGCLRHRIAGAELFEHQHVGRQLQAVGDAVVQFLDLAFLAGQLRAG